MKFQLKGSNWAYDGKYTLYTPTKHPLFSKAQKAFSVEMPMGDRTKSYDVHVQWTANINFSDLYRYLKQGDIKCPENVLMNLETLLRHGATKDPNCSIYNRSIFFNNPGTNIILPGNTELWLGYHQSVKVCQSGLCLNIDTTYATFLRKGPIIDFLMHIAQVIY